MIRDSVCLPRPFSAQPFRSKLWDNQELHQRSSNGKTDEAKRLPTRTLGPHEGASRGLVAGEEIGPGDPNGGNGPSDTPPLLHRIRTCSNKDLLVLLRSLLAMRAMVKVAANTIKTNATKTPEGGTVNASRKPTK